VTLHLAEISDAVAPGAHAVLLLDQAGWHGSRDFVVPDNSTLLPLPPRSPEIPWGVNSDRSSGRVESPTNSQEVRNASCSQL
jgi:hypothetical protein